MRIEYANLSLILVLVAMLWHFKGQLPVGTDSDIVSEPPVENSETAFALGRRVKLSEVDLYDLELIPRLSEVVAIRILEQRNEIIDHARNLPTDQKYLALTKVRGVGAVTAMKLNNYLVLK